jgi:hypothetical protein
MLGKHFLSLLSDVDCFGINDAGTLIPLTKEIAFVPVMMAQHSFRHSGCHLSF